MKKFIMRLFCFLLPILAVVMPILLIGCMTGEMTSLNWSMAKQWRKKESLVGMAYNDAEAYYKMKNANHYQAEIVALGTSRVLEFSSEYFVGDFYNCGRGVTYNFDEYKNFLENLTYTPEVMILGLDPWVFHDGWNEGCPSWNEYKKITYHKRENMEIVRSLVEAYQAGKWELHDLKNYPENCGLNGIVKNNGYRWDGSYYYGEDYRDAETTSEKRLRDTFDRIKVGEGRFAWGTKVSERTLALLEELLSYCKAEGIEVIGFFPPLAPSVYAAMTESENYTYVASLMQETTPLFTRYGYQVFDYLDGESLGVSDEAFIDGFHGSEVVYGLLILDMLPSSKPLQKIIDAARLQELYEQRYSELTFTIPR